MAFWDNLDELGGDLLDSAGGALADRIGSEIRGDYSGTTGAEAQPDMMVEVPQDGPEQAEVTATVQDRVKGALSGWLPWAGLALGVTAIVMFRRAR